MTKNEWIKLINAIRLRKKEYSGQDGEITYRFRYSKESPNRSYGLNKDTVYLSYDQCSFGIRSQQNNFSLTCVYDHQLSVPNLKQEDSLLEKISKFHSGEAFIPHISTAHPTTAHGAFGGYGHIPDNANEFLYHSGFYAAAFLYAFDVKDPYLQLFDDEWIVVDSKTGYFDFPTYFSHHQVIPIKLPIPKFIDPKQVPILKLASGVEIRDSIDPPAETTDKDDTGEDLKEIPESIEENQTS